MDFKNFGLRELSLKEKIEINGGGALVDALQSIWDAICETVSKVCYEVSEWWYQRRADLLRNHYQSE